MSDQDPFNCCPGEPFMGDPNGLHTFDCPTYEANMDRLQRLNEKAAAEREPAVEQWREAMTRRKPMSYDPTGGYYRPTQTPAPKPKRHVWPWLVGAALALCVLGTIVAAVTGRGDGKTPGPVASKAVQIAEGAASRAPAKSLPKSAAPPAKPKPVTVGAGSWEVGTEVKPGTWTTTAVDNCYWARLSADGDTDAIIDNGNLEPGAHGRIAVKRTDKGLELRGACTWKRAS